MNPKEFSNQFDVLLSSYRRFKSFDHQEMLDSIEVDEYEKSIFLTKAQEELILSLYNGRNPMLQSFEETEELRRYLSNLVEEVTLSPITSTSGKPIGVDSNSKFFTLPDDLWFITYESVSLGNGECDGHTKQDVYPITQDEYHKIKKNPFRGANFHRALRLDLSENNIEIVSKYQVTGYYVRYVRKIKPIILENLPEDLTIEGINVITPSEVHESLHQKILESAVQMALQSKIGNSATTSKNNNRE